MIILVLFYLIIKSHGDITPNTNRPKILTQNGNLRIQGAFARDVYIETMKGTLYFNGKDLSNMFKQDRNVSSKISSRLLHLEFVTDQLMIGQEFLKNHLSSNTSLSNVSFPVMQSSMTIRRINVRLINLKRKLIALERALYINECSSSPCRNGGTCQDLYKGFLCLCPSQWEGPTCEIDVNECERWKGTDLGCKNGAACVNKAGSFECICQKGWFGVHCSTRNTDCSVSLELCGHGTCLPANTDLGYKCLCDVGWTTDGTATNPACNTDVDECKLNHPPCSINPKVSCENRPGSFSCGPCPVGYTGNGYYCVDINECEIFNGGCSVSPQVTCINTLGSSTCGPCPPGYQGDGRVCSYKGICHVNNGGCHPLATCQDNQRIGSYYVQCTCPSGYSGNGIGPQGCTPNASINPCNPNPCNNGNCTVTANGGYACKCQKKYSGRNCEILLDPCNPNPCENGGTCTIIFSSFYRCHCRSSFNGYNCEFEKQACGGRLKSQNGSLEYPTKDFIGGTVSCAWIIETNSSLILNITFSEFKIGTAGSCRYNWLQIHDGRNTASHNIGRFCGTTRPSNGSIISTDNAVYMWYRSDRPNTNNGFKLSWTSTIPTCSDTIIAKTYGSIQSPGSPGKYPNNRDCHWHLIAPLDKRILFHFFSLMIGDNADCSQDYLEFMDNSVNRNIFAKFCNSTHPSPLRSPTNEATIHFHSDSKYNYPGFQITYSLIDGIPGCGAVYTLSKGEITSPTPNPEYGPANCEFQIKLLPQSRIKITFLYFQLDEECVNTVSILNNEDGSLIGRYCGTSLPGNIITNSNNLRIVYKTNFNLQNEGFKLKYSTECGRIFSKENGTITSPGYPNQYVNGLQCIYQIVRPPGDVISLKFDDLNIESSSTGCLYDYLEIRDGDNMNSTLIGKYCTKVPPVILSSHNVLWVKFSSDSDLSGRGFKLSYNSTNVGCGGILKENLGTLKSPFYGDSTYPSKKKCVWILSAPPGNVIQLSWFIFKLEASIDCVYDKVAIFENNTETGKSERLGEFCGSNAPPTLLSSTNIMTIIFTSDNSINMDGFIASYLFLKENQICGGNYVSSSGLIKTPNYPNSYPVDRQCTWTISVNPGQQIMLNVLDFDIENSKGCRYDWLEIRNGGTAASPLIGRFCGKDIPKSIPSHTNKLHLVFLSDLTKPGHGFKLNWTSTTTGCGGNLNSPMGSIISPHYPEPYPKNTICIWKVTVNAGSLIQVIFSDLQLEKHTICLSDYVELYDGNALNSKSLGRYCSNKHIPIIQTTTNKLLVKFKSDLSIQERGFQLQYSIVCNLTLTGFRGVIESPNFPNPYPANQVCSWNITVPKGNKIKLAFSHFELESSSKMTYTTCPFDYIEIKYVVIGPDFYDNPQEQNLVKQGRYCGHENPGTILIDSNYALINFVSDLDLLGNGFRLEWQTEGCGGILKADNGQISSPNYPKGYSPHTECQWLIQVPFGKSVQLTFRSIDIELSNDCFYDYIDIYNGPDTNYNLLSKICRQSKPITVTSSGNSMFVHFLSDGSNGGRGFLATYRAIATTCGGKMSSSYGTITTPNYPNNYNTNDTCGWLIEVEESHRVNLDFTDVDLLPTAICKECYIKVFDGPSEAYPVLAKLTGVLKPNNTITSTYNFLYVEFRSNHILTSKGFKAKYSTQCGSRIVASTGGFIQIEEHSFPSDATNCSWTIVNKDPAQHVSLTISKMFNSDHYCDFGMYPVRIYNGETPDAPLLKEFCKSKLPPTIYSDGNALHITVDQSLDFFATYAVLDTQCGGTLESEEGNFASPGYPNRYPFGIKCEWVIKIAAGNTLSINFVDVDIPTSDNCNQDFVEIRETNSAGKILGVYCGNKQPNTITHMGSVWVLFQSSSPTNDSISIESKGFQAEFKLETSNVLTGPKGVIASPFYPKKIVPYESVSYKIVVSNSKRILITVKDLVIDDTFETECSVIGLKIFDGEDSNALHLGSFCGMVPPDPIKTSGNVAFIVIQTFYGNWKSSLFYLEWLEIDLPRKSLPVLRKNVTGCGSNETIDINANKNITVTSPGYPKGYESNLECEWIFSTISSNHIQIKILDINFNYRFLSGSCFRDVIKIYTRSLISDWSLSSTICQKSVVSEPVNLPISNLVKVVFTSAQHSHGTGFKMEVKDVCGGTMTEPTGLILFNNETAPSTSCDWNITVKAGRTIKLEFLKFELGAVNTCRSYLMIRNGIFLDSPLLGPGKFCPGPLPEALQSTGNSISIRYKGYLSIKGFALSYREVSFDCGGQFSLNSYEKSIEITSPFYPNIPTPHIECKWMIMAPSGERLRIDFEDRFDITDSYNCNLDYVEVRDGGTENSPLIGKYCHSLPSSQFSTDNVMFVKFFTDADEPKNGFKAKISIAHCGGTLRGFWGTLSSPTGLSQVINCTWTIKPYFEYVNLSFQKMNIKTSGGNCTKYVSIKAEDPSTSELETIGTYCGTKTPPDIEASNPVINFFAKELQSNEGFTLRYDIKRLVCGGSLSAPEGIITSPGYPDRSTANRRCSWTITVPKGRRIKLEILDMDFDPTFVGHEQGLLVYEGTEIFRSVALFTSKNPSKIIWSSDNSLRIYYWVLHSSQRRGFKVRYSSDSPTICIGDMNQDSGIIKQPKSDSNIYTCLYERTNNKNNQTLVMKITTLVPEKTKMYNNDCMFKMSHISVYIGYLSLSRICQNQTDLTIRTSSPRVRIAAVSNDKNDTLNFTVNYNTYPCGGVIVGDKGNITSPNFPNKYPDSIECAWTLHLNQYSSIKLNLTHLNLGDDCEKSFLIIYNGKSIKSPRIGKYCGNKIPDIIQSQSNEVFIEYKQDKTSQSTGFHLTYEPIIKGCGGHFHDQYKIIESPDYPNNYPSNAECLWEVSAQSGYYINLKFTGRFFIEENENCTNDFVEIFDYIDSKWTSARIYCGRNIPKPYQSVSPYLRILFRSNSQINAAGFRAEWSFHCGGIYEATEELKYIVSPGYPFGYKSSLNCVYVIKSESKVKVEFIDFNLEEGNPQCNHDKVSVNTTGLRQYKNMSFCGSEIPSQIWSNKYINITFTTDSFINMKGFNFSYTSLRCGGNISSPTSIKSGFNPNRWIEQVNCNWFITAPQKKIISLHIKRLGPCRLANLNIYDGFYQTNNSLAHLCEMPPSSGKSLSIISSSNKMKISLSTYYLNNMYFEADISFTYGQSEGCGGIFNINQETTFDSPKGLQDAFCLWQFFAPEDHQLSIEFTKLNLSICPDESQCSCSYIEILDGTDVNSELIVSLCSIHGLYTKKISSTYRSLTLKLNTINSTNAFAIKLTPSSNPCGKTLYNVTKDAQVITSPNYPNPYPAGIKCAWKFITSNEVLFKFLDFDVGQNLQYTNTNTCLTDKVKLSYASSDIHGSFGRLYPAEHLFCGKRIPHFFTAKPPITLSLTTVDVPVVDRKKGFKIQFSLASCNGNYTELEGSLKGNVPVGNCYINLTVPKNRTISLTFVQFFFFKTDRCNSSGVEITEGSKTLLRSCGMLTPDPIFSTSHSLSIHFWRKRADFASFYELAYTSTDKGKGCGGIYTSMSARISSPLFPLEFKNDTLCTWEIQAPVGETIQLRFTEFDITDDCERNYLKIYQSSNQVGTKFCKNDRLNEILSIEYMKIEYKASVHNKGRGWLLSYNIKRTV